jgi:hypothetical protein
MNIAKLLSELLGSIKKKILSATFLQLDQITNYPELKNQINGTQIKLA